MGRFTNNPETSPQLTTGQARSGRSLINSIGSVFGIPHDRFNYFGHYHFAPVRREACPGYPVRSEFLPWTVPNN